MTPARSPHDYLKGCHHLSLGHGSRLLPASPHPARLRVLSYRFVKLHWAKLASAQADEMSAISSAPTRDTWGHY